MRIQHNIPAMNAYRNYKNNNAVVNKNLEKLSSGYRINRAGDDAAGLAISEKMRAQITGLKVAQKNAKDGIGLIQTAEGALTEVHSMLNRMYELAEQSANGTYASSVDRKALDMEVQALKKEIDRIATTANFNGKKLFTGGMPQLRFIIGENGNAANFLTMSLSNVAFGAVDLDAVGGDIHVENLGIGDIAISQAGTADETAGTALGALTAITAALNAISMLRGKLGAYQNRLEHTINNLSVMQENVQDAESSIRDTDVADEMMAYTKNNIMIQSAQAMLAQANQQPQGVLQLLQ